MHHAQPPTRRPSPSTADSEVPPDDLAANVGNLMAAQARQERAFAALRTEVNTFITTSLETHQAVQELLTEQKRTTRAVKRLGKFGTAALAAFEVLRPFITPFIKAHFPGVLP
jgi:hypothetical protein